MLDSTRVSALSFPRHYESTANLRHKSVKGWEIIITCNAHPPQITLSCELYIFYIYINLQSGYFTSELQHVSNCYYYHCSYHTLNM